MNSLRDQMEAMVTRVDDIHEKMWDLIFVSLPKTSLCRYEFEQTKKNNLIFYGIANDPRENQVQV